MDDPSIETASNFSRPSRVKHYYSGYDSASSVGSSVSQRFEGKFIYLLFNQINKKCYYIIGRRRHVPGFYPHHDKGGPHSSSGMSMGSSGMHYPGMGMSLTVPNCVSNIIIIIIIIIILGYPMPSYQQYPFFPAMVAQYYGYPYPPQAFPVRLNQFTFHSFSYLILWIVSQAKDNR